MSGNLRKIILFLVLIAISYVSYVYMIKPANENLKEQRALVEQKKAKLAELERAKAAAEDLSKQLKQLEEAIKFFESKLPHTSQIHTVLENVTLIAQKHGLTPKTIRTLNLKQNSGYIEQPLEMELNGNFNSYYSFLLELEKLDRITKIRELKLKKMPKSDGFAEADFVVSIFFQGRV